MKRAAKVLQYVATVFVLCVVIEAMVGPLSMISYGRMDVIPPAKISLFWYFWITPLVLYGYRQYVRSFGPKRRVAR